MPQVMEKLIVRYFAVGSSIKHGNLQGTVCGIDKVRCKMRIRATKVLRPISGLRIGGIYDVPFGEGTELVAFADDYCYLQEMDTGNSLETIDMPPAAIAELAEMRQA